MAIYYDIKILYKNKNQMARLYANKLELREEGDSPVFAIQDLKIKYRFPLSVELSPLTSNEPKKPKEPKTTTEKIILPLNRFTRSVFFPSFGLFVTSFSLLALLAFLFPFLGFYKTSLTIALFSSFFSVMLNLLLAVFFIRQVQQKNKKAEKAILYVFFLVTLLAIFLFFRFSDSYVFVLSFYLFLVLLVFLSIFAPLKNFWRKITFIFSWLFTVIASFYCLLTFLFISFDSIQIYQNRLTEFSPTFNQAEQFYSLEGADNLTWQIKNPFQAKQYSTWMYPLRANFSPNISLQLFISEPKFLLSYFDHKDIGYAGVFPATADQTFILLKKKFLQKQFLFWSVSLENSPLLELDTQTLNSSLRGKTLLQKITMKNLIDKKDFSLIFLMFQNENSLYTRFWLFDLPKDSSVELLLASVFENLTAKDLQKP